MENHIWKVFMDQSRKWHILVLTFLKPELTSSSLSVTKEAGKYTVTVSQAKQISGSWGYALGINAWSLDKCDMDRRDGE